MANEWTKVELYGQNNNGGTRRYTVGDGVAFSKGAVLALLDPRTASVALSTSTVFAGVAAEEHCPNLGITDVAVWTDGIFEATASGAITIGYPVTGTATNYVKVLKPLTAQVSGALIGDLGAAKIGYVLEEAADLEVVNVRLRL